MLTTLVAITLLCKPARDESWQQQDGKYTVALNLEQGTLSLSDASGPRWSIHHAHVHQGQVLVTDDGTVVIEYPGYGGVEVIGVDGKPRGTVSIKKQLTEDELEKLPFSDCGRSYFHSPRLAGTHLLVDVSQERNRRPNEPPGPELTVSVDLATLQASRPAPPALEPIDAMIGRFRAATTADDRRAVSYELLARARHQEGKGDAALRALCHEWADGKAGDELRESGVQCLDSAGSDAEVEALTRLPASKADGAILGALDRRKSPARFDYALKILSEHREPDTLRQQAVFIACAASSPDSFKAARVATQDPSARVRGWAGYQVSEWPAGETGFELLSTLATDADQEVRDKARDRLLSTFLGARGSRDFERDFVELVNHGKLQGWGAAWIVLGGIDEVQGKPAVADYLKGLELIGATLPPRGGNEITLWAEAKLRLAQLALDKGDKKKAKALATDVVKADPNGNVQAPRPNAFSGYRSPSGVTVRSPKAAAEELLDLVAGKKKKR